MAAASKSVPAASSSDALIRAAGVKVTRGRVRVLDALRGARQPLCHGEIEALLGGDGASALDRVTLYRILDSLVACGLALNAMQAAPPAAVADLRGPRFFAHFSPATVPPAPTFRRHAPFLSRAPPTFQS